MPLPIRTERLLIREWIVPDAKSFYPLSQDPILNSIQANQDDAERKIIEWALVFGQTKMGILPVFLKNQKTQIGICGIKPLMVEQARLHFEVICRIASEFAVENYEAEVLAAMFDYGFKDLGLQELVASGSPKILEELGMSFLKSVSLQNKKVDLFSVSAQ